MSHGWNMWPWSTKAVLSRWGCSNSKKYIVWVKIIDFSYIPKIISILRSCSMKIFCKCSMVNISKLNFWLLICIENFIWTTLKMIFSIFRFFLHPQIPDLQILSDHNKPYINGNIIYSASRWCIHLNFRKLTLMTGFVLQGHIMWLSTTYVNV